MNSKSALQRLTFADLQESNYDLLLVAHGYEARATAIAKSISSLPASCLAFGFDHNKVESYQSNEVWFGKNGFTIFPDLSSDIFYASLLTVLGKSLAPENANNIGKSSIRIAVDISCFDRRRLSEIVIALRKISQNQCIEIDFWYCIAQFELPTSSPGRNEIAGPVHRRFAGRYTDPGRPLALVAGLGYEIGRVMGAAEYLQASRVIALFPESPVNEYEEEVIKANKLLLDDLKPREVVRYPVDDPIRTIATLDSIVRGLQETHNVVLLPGGPKVFVLACLLTQTQYPNTSVWRVSSGSSIKPKNVKPSNFFVGLRWRMDPPN